MSIPKDIPEVEDLVSRVEHGTNDAMGYRHAEWCPAIDHSDDPEPPDESVCQCKPAAPTSEALRDALVKDVIDAYQVDAVGRVIYDPPTFRDRLIELEAAARADERTRLSGRHGPRGGSWPGRTR